MDETSPLLAADNGEHLTRHQKAAWVLEEIIRGASIMSGRQVPPTRRNRSVYLFFRNTEWLRLSCVFLLIALSFFELPSWCSANRACYAPDLSELPNSGIPYLSGKVSIIINSVLLAVLIFFVLLDFSVSPMKLHLQDTYLFLLLAVLFVDNLYLIYYGGYPPIRFSPILRSFLPMFYWPNLKECTVSITAVVSPFFDVVVFVVLFTIVFGWVVTVMFHDVPEADKYFGDLTTGIYSGFTSMTTADWPMQVVGIMEANYLTTAVFILFIVIGVFILFNILLAVVYNAYTGHIEELVTEKFQNRITSLSVAYDVLRGESLDSIHARQQEELESAAQRQIESTPAEEQGEGEDGEAEEVTGENIEVDEQEIETIIEHTNVEGENMVTLHDVSLMFRELRKNNNHSRFNDDVVELVFTALDDDGDNKLSRDEFTDVVNVMQLKFVEDFQAQSPIETYFPSFYSTDTWQGIATYVQSSHFTYVVDAFMIFNLLVVLIETTMDLQGKDTETSVVIFSLIECAFSVIYLVEMVLKIVVVGFRKYWADVGNRFDFWITVLLLLASGYVLLPYVENSQDIIRLFIILRCLRLISLLADVPRFRQLVRVFSVLIPASVPLFSFMFLSIFVFSSLGTEMFGGLIYKGNPALNPEINSSVDAYVSANYWVLNFNDVTAGWFTIFCSIIVAYLTEIAAVTTSVSVLGGWSKLFFIANFIVNTLIVSNCVVAFVVDLFVEEDEAEASSEDNRSALIADVQSRYGSKRVKVIMARSTAHQVYANMFKERLEEIIATKQSDAGKKYD